MQRQCRKCNNLFQATAKGQRKCESCKESLGKRKTKFLYNRNPIDPKKLMVLKKKLDKMSYARAIS